MAGRAVDLPLRAPLRERPGWRAAWGFLSAAGDMGRMAGQVARALVVPPFTWPRSAVAEMSQAIRRCLLPLSVCTPVFVIASAVIITGEILRRLGTVDRFGGGMIVAVDREVGVWVTTMVVAGVAGSAICADLGARKVREELDALGVLGVSTLKGLIAPRVAALTFVCPLLGLYAVMLWMGTAFVANRTALGSTDAAFQTTMTAFLSTTDVIAFVIKLALIGFFVGVVACQRGVSARGGPEGVGRAVAQTVLITYVGIWLFNVTFNLTYLSVFPGIQVLR
jgi:phospholipid/cholesterol/gamma-HCH transport system permease protein